MAVNIGGSRRKSRHKLKKERRNKGKISISRFMQSFKAGQKVHLIPESAMHKGDYHTRFIGKTGTVKASRGKCYEVAITDGNKEKLLIVHPIHLKMMSD
jgi:large subunit ribosomal protein L21e